MTTRHAVLTEADGLSLPDPATGNEGDVVTVGSGGEYELAAPAGGVDTSWQALPDTGWTAGGTGIAAITAGVATLTTINSSGELATLRRTQPGSPHMPAVEFVARVRETATNGAHAQGIGLCNTAFTRGARVQVDIYGNVTIYYNVAGTWTSGAYVNVGGAWSGATLWLRMVATPLFIHFYHGTAAGPTPPTSWTRVGSYDLSSAAAPDFIAPLADGLTDLVLFATRTGGSGNSVCTAQDLQQRSLLGAPA